MSRPGAKYCSRACYIAHHDHPVGEQHPSWKGDDVGYWGARDRTQREVPPGACEECGAPADRHHIDGNILDNRPENIRYLCRSHHIALHHQQERQCGD